MFARISKPKNKLQKVQLKALIALIFSFCLLSVIDLQSNNYDDLLIFKSEVAFADVNVTSCEQFQGTAAAGTNLIDNPGETFLLQNDIDCAGASISPIFPSNNKFTGIFEGNGFTLSNFIVPSSSRASLFGYTSSSTIQNLTIRDAGVTCDTGGYCAVLIGDDTESTIDNITLINTTLTQNGGNDRMGSVIGSGLGSQVSNVTVDDFQLTCDQLFSGSCQYLGGALGFISDNATVQAFIQNVSVNNATIYGHDNIGGVIGYISESNADNLTATNITLGGLTNVGGVVGQLLGTNGLEAYLDNSSATNVTHDPQAYLTATGNSSTSVTAVGGLIGTASNYTSVNCGGETTNFYNSSLASTVKVGGLIGDANFLAATASDAVNYTVENCTTSGSIEGRTYLGGVIGEAAEGRYNNLNSTVNIKFTGSSPNIGGGIMGWFDFLNPVEPVGLSNCSYTGQISLGDYTGTTPSYLGGIAGDLDHASIDNCTVDVSILSPESIYIGGAVGAAGGSTTDLNNVISNITANVELQGEQYVGGIVGQATGYLLDNNSASGTIDGNPNDLTRYFGGIVGQLNGTSSGVYARVTNSNSSVLIRKVVLYAGGIVGFGTYSPILQSYNTGDIEVFQGYAGGIAGSLQNGNATFPIEEVYNTGDIYGQLDYIGGLIGNMTAAIPINNSYSRGNVTGGERIGGLIGNGSNALITNSYSAGRVIGADNFGGFVGAGNASTLSTDSYWDIETSKQINSYVGTPKTTEEMYTPATYSTWDSDTIWNICTENYPVLQSVGESCPVLEPVVFEVNTNQDTSDTNLGDNLCEDSNGKCSLRAAMEEFDSLNLAGRENRIIFNLPSDQLTIQLDSSLPTVNNLQMNINATTQSGYLGAPIVEIDASLVTGSDPIFDYSNADSSILQGLSIFGSTHGASAMISVLNSDDIIFKNNYFGLDSLGQDGGTTLPLALEIDNSDRTLVKDNIFAHPVDIIDSNNIEASDNIFELINTISNDFGLQFRDGANAFIFRNDFYDIARAIVIRDDSASLPVIENNIKENEGTNITLMIDLIDDSNADTIGKNTNDLDDADDGPNKLINSPELSQVSYDNATRTLTINGDFNSEDGNYRFDFYTSDGNDESRKYINFFIDSVLNNNVTFTNQTLLIPRRDVVPSYISATAQDTDGNTSEHSQLLAVDSILITSCDQLAGGNPAAVANHIEDDYSAFYRLANDIDCSAYTGGTTFDPIGSNTSAEYFKGVLVGDGYTISNLEISDAGTYIGLFARTETAIIQDVNFENVSINCTTNSSNYCGLITGYADQTSVEDINVTQGIAPGANPVGLTGLGTYTGGLVGYTRASNFLNINSDLDVIGNTASDSYFGGIAGYTSYYKPTNRGYIPNEFQNVHVTGDVTGFSYVGGITGKGEDIDMLDVSYSGTVTGYSSYVGGISGSVNSSSLSTVLAKAKNATVNANIVSGPGGSGNSYGGAFGIVNNGIFENIMVTGTVDVEAQTRVGGAFGSLNGNSAYAVNDTMSASHPFYAKNITANVDISNSNGDVGGIAGYTGYMNLSNINYSGTISHDSPGANHSNIAGLIGNGTYVVVDGGSATSPNPISYATNNSGGAFGNIPRLDIDGISSDISLPNIKSNGGGLVGLATYLNISNSYATGDIGDSALQSSTTRLGGLVGGCTSAFCYITDSYSTGTVDADGSRNGGIAGDLSAPDIVMTNVYSTSDITATGLSVGGLVGYLSSSGGTATLTDTYATGTVVSTIQNNIGALIGQHAAGQLDITESYTSGNISTGDSNGVSHCGGLVGLSAGTLNVTRSYSYGSYSCQSLGSTGSPHGFGGLVGEMATGSILDSYSHANITANYDSGFTSDDSYLGGLVGNITGATTVTDSYSTGSITSLYSPPDPADDPVIGGLVGNAPSTTFTDSFWDTQTSGILTSAGGTGKLTSEMQDQDTFTTGGPDWDFTTTWEMCAGGGYPTHQWMNYCPLDNPYTFEVNTTNDTEDSELGDRTCLDIAGNCSLRAALQEMAFMQANEQESVSYEINFNIPGVGPHNIQLDSTLGYLDTLSGLTNLTINGESEPDFTSSPVVYIDSTEVNSPGSSILSLDETTNTVIQGLGFINFNESSDSILNIANSNNITLDNLRLGINSSGQDDGVTSGSARSILFSNTSGSTLQDSSLSRSISIESASANNTIQNNSLNLTNSTQPEGVYVLNSSNNTVFSNTFSSVSKAMVVNEETGQSAINNTLSQNTAQGVTTRVIELQVDGSPAANTNDIAQDLDNGANTLLNFPVISDSTYNGVADTLNIQGTVETANAADYYIEFYESDGDTDEALSYLGASAPFTVSGNLYNFDLTLNGITSIPLNVTSILIDSSGNTSQHSADISLNEPPTDIQISNDTVDETPEGGPFDTATVGVLTTTDADVDATHTYEVISVDGDTESTIFSIGGLGDSLIQNVPFDYETKTSYSVLIRTTDNNGVSYQESLTIQVNDLNDVSPDLTPENFSVNEDNADPQATLTVTDPDTVGTVSLTITGGADQDDFELTDNTLSFKAASLPLDFETKSSYTVQVTASDGVNTDDTESFTFNIQDVNEAQTVVSPVGDFAVDQGSPIAAVDASSIFDDQDAGANGTLTYTATLADTNPLPDWLSFDGTTLTGAPANQDVGITSIRITAQDTGGLSISDTFDITVNNINDAPVVEDQNLGSIPENTAVSTVVGTVTALDPDTPYGDTISFSITGGNTDLNANETFPFSIDSSSGVITVADPDDLDFETQATFLLTVTVTDDGAGNLSDSATITITITDADDEAPVFTTPATLSIQENETSIATIESTDVDTIGTVPTYSITGGPDQDLFTLNEATNELSFITAPDFEIPTDANSDSIYQVEITAEDISENQSTQLFSIQVSDLEETTPSSSGSAGGTGSTSSPFGGSDSGDGSDSGVDQSDDSQEESTEDATDEQTPEEIDEDTPEDETVEGDQEESEDSSPDNVQEAVDEGQDESADDSSSQTSDSSSSDDSNQDQDDENDQETPEDDNESDQDSDQGDDDDSDDESNQQQQQQNNSSGGGSSSSGGGGGRPAYVRPPVQRFSCDDIDSINFDEFDFAELDCDPLLANLPEPESDESRISLNLAQSSPTSFPDENFYITGKVFNVEDVSEVEVYAEVNEGNNIILGQAEVDDFGNFSLLNRTPVPKDTDFQIKARAIVQNQQVESDEYSVRLSGDQLPPIPTELITFTNKSAESLIQNEDGYFTFVNTEELLNGLEVRVESKFRTKHNVYWNSILIGSTAITGSNSNQTTIYAPESVVESIEPFSRHKVTIVAESLDNPDQKGTPLVINYIYVPTGAYYTAYILIALVLFISLARRLKKKKDKPELDQI